MTHTLAIEGGGEPRGCRVIVREIPGERAARRDLALRLPGRARRAGPPPEPGDVDWSRDRAGQPLRPRPDRRPAPRSRAAPSAPRSRSPTRRAESGVRKRLREQIRRNERRGLARRPPSPGSEAEPEDRAAFERAYARDDGADRAPPSATSTRAPTSSELLRRRAAPGCCWRAARASGRRRGRSRSPATATSTTTSAAPPTRRSPTRR